MSNGEDRRREGLRRADGMSGTRQWVVSKKTPITISIGMLIAAVIAIVLATKHWTELRDDVDHLKEQMEEVRHENP